MKKLRGITKQITVGVIVISMVLIFSGCSASDSSSSTEAAEQEGERTNTAITVIADEDAESAHSSEAVEEKDTQEVGLIACYDDQVMEILDGSIDEDTLTVKIRFTNNSSDGYYAYESFACTAYQDGIELEDVTDINDDEMGAALIRGVKDGTSIEGAYKYIVSSDSDVEFLICTPTAEQEILAKKVFTQND